MNIRDAIESEDYESAIKILDEAFHHKPEDDGAAFYFATVMLHTDHPGPARFILSELVKRNPGKWQGWMNLGLAYDELEDTDNARECLNKALDLSPEDAHPQIWSNLSTAETKAQQWSASLEWAEKALAHMDSIQCEVNKGFAYLNTGEFGKGWDQYAKGVGHMQWRERREFGRPHYDGEKDAKVLIYGEQGVGDQIAFLSALPDAMEQGLDVAGISCYPKLAALFSDTFPGVEVHGTHFVDAPAWIEETGFTHVMPMSWLHKFYRRTAESYTGEPYLRVNPAKSLQWKALLDSVSDKPKVGIAWTGGKRGSHSWRAKSMAMSDLQELLQVDVDWICLEYKDRSEDIAWMHRENGLLIREWPWSTRTDDYSDTAALVANLDALVTIPTSVNHLAGGLGIPVHCLVNEKPHFHYSAGMPYYGSVKLYQRDQMDQVIEAIQDFVPRIVMATS